MKVPVSWLRRYVDVSDLSLDELVDLMSLNGLEVEELHAPGRGTSGVRTKKVVSWEKHPDADKLRVVQVTDGEQEIELVCGASNFDVGDVVAHAEVGATIPPSGGGTEPFELEKRKLRGVVSNGMLCSSRELQLGEDHDGIMILAPDTPLGEDLTQLLPLGEPVIEVAVLADRGDHHSILGIAREVAAILDRPVTMPEIDASDPGGGVEVDIAPAGDGVLRFETRTVEGVEVGPSPWWVVQRLAQCGVRSINNVVDVTNLVMLELGQPLHAFDLDTLVGDGLTVRWAEDGETLITLDDQERALVSTDLVIADADGIASLAGVMGGARTEVGNGTTRVLLEAATWEPQTIRRTSRRLNLISEASLRFERRVDPELAPIAVARAAELLTQIGGGRVVAGSGVGDAGQGHDAISLDTGWCARFLGLDEQLDAETQAGFLRRVGCEITVDGDRLSVVPPNWRGDLSRPADLSEEVARLYGYERIPSSLPAVTVRGGLTPTQKAEREVRQAALAAGFHEARTRPFVGDDALEGVVPTDGRVELGNPLAKDAAFMAPTLVEGLLKTIRRNVGQGRPGTAVFEMARIFRPAGDAIESSLAPFGESWRWSGPDGTVLPVQPRTLGLVAQGLRLGSDWLDESRTWNVHDVIGVLDEVIARLAPPAEPWTMERRATERDGFHPGRTATLHLDGVEVGIVGQLHPDEADRRDLVEPVVVAELLLEPLLAHLAEDAAPTQAGTLVTHPAMNVDVALVADESVSYAVLEGAVRAAAGDLLDELWFFDEYRGEQLGEGKRSVAIRLRLQSPDRQLTDEDAESVISAVGREAESVGANLRS